MAPTTQNPNNSQQFNLNMSTNNIPVIPNFSTVPNVPYVQNNNQNSIPFPNNTNINNFYNNNNNLNTNLNNNALFSGTSNQTYNFNSFDYTKNTSVPPQNNYNANLFPNFSTYSQPTPQVVQ